MELELELVEPMADEQEPMTRERALKELSECDDMRDPERAHSAADGILCELLTALGYADVVEEYDKIRKWYA